MFCVYVNFHKRTLECGTCDWMLKLLREKGILLKTKKYPFVETFQRISEKSPEYYSLEDLLSRTEIDDLPYYRFEAEDYSFEGYSLEKIAAELSKIKGVQTKTVLAKLKTAASDTARTNKIYQGRVTKSVKKIPLSEFEIHFCN